jgi:hypothetical protein
MPIDLRQYDSALSQIKDGDTSFSRLVGNLTNSDDRLRVKAYELWEDFYSNRPEHIKVVLRGEDDDSIEIYIPSGKKCIEAVNRFLAINFDYQVDPEANETDAQAVDEMLQYIFKKQDIVKKFNQMKRYMLIKGDALLHIRALPWERKGYKVCVEELKPEHYFPIEDFVSGATVGCHIVDVIRNPKNGPKTRSVSDEWMVRRQTYRRAMREDNDGNRIPTGRITSELGLWRVGKWDDRNAENKPELIEELQEEFELDARITNIPVYHWANNPPPGSTFGMSELAGVESLLNAINQSATDEDLTLITQGLGVYWTDASPPVDENGNEVEWEIGPGAVVQVGTGANFGRVSGVSSVAPFHDHIKLLDENVQQAMGVPDVAIGMVDVQTVESGIALQLKFGPLLAHTAEMEPTVQKIMDELLEDLLVWLEIYEQLAVNGVTVTSTFGDPMPKNKAEELKDILDIWTQAAGVLPVVDWLYERLNELFGWDLSQVDFDQALEDAQKITTSSTPPDLFGQQMDAQGNPMPGGQPPPNGQSQNGNTFDLASLGG